jgi:regulator of RNase E activity RraA
VVVADGDGAVLIPATLAEEVARLGAEQEELESWLMDEVKAGKSLPGLYPPNEETLARYNARKKG